MLTTAFLSAVVFLLSTYLFVASYNDPDQRISDYSYWTMLVSISVLALTGIVHTVIKINS